MIYVIHFLHLIIGHLFSLFQIEKSLIISKFTFLMTPSKYNEWQKNLP